MHKQIYAHHFYVSFQESPIEASAYGRRLWLQNLYFHSHKNSLLMAHKCVTYMIFLIFKTA